MHDSIFLAAEDLSLSLMCSPREPEAASIATASMRRCFSAPRSDAQELRYITLPFHQEGIEAKPLNHRRRGCLLRLRFAQRRVLL
jgi:hypothetical protein